MKRWLVAAALSLAGLFALTQCATDNDDPFPVKSSVNADVPVAGAPTPSGDDSSAGWKW